MPVVTTAAASDRKPSRQPAVADPAAEQEPLSDETESEGDEDEAMEESDGEQTSTASVGEIPPLRLNEDGLAPPSATSACSYSEYMVQRIARRNQNADQFNEGLNRTERRRMDTVHVELSPTVRLSDPEAEPIVCSAETIKQTRYAFSAAFLVMQDTHQNRKADLLKSSRMKSVSKTHQSNAKADVKYLSRQGPKGLPTREDMSLRIDTVNALFGQSASLHIRLAVLMWLASAKAGKTKSLAFRHLVLSLLYDKSRFKNVETVTDCFRIVTDKSVAFYETLEFSKTLRPYEELNALHVRAVPDLLEAATNAYRNRSATTLDATSTSLHFIATQLKDALDKNCILYGTHRWFLDGLIDTAAILGHKNFALGEWVSGMAMDVDEDSYRLLIDMRLSGTKIDPEYPYHQAMLGSLLSRYHSRNGAGTRFIKDSKNELNRKAVLSLFPSLQDAYRQNKECECGDNRPQKLEPNTKYEVFMTVGMHSNCLTLTTNNGFQVIMYQQVIYDVVADDKGQSLLHLTWKERLAFCNGPVKGVRISVEEMFGRDVMEKRKSTFRYTDKSVEASLMYESGPKQFTRFTMMLKKGQVAADRSSSAEVKSEPEN